MIKEQMNSKEIKRLYNVYKTLYLKKKMICSNHIIEVAEKSFTGWDIYRVINGVKERVDFYPHSTFLFMLQNNDYLVSTTPMNDTEHYNFD